ncbi:MAG: hypothetical protein HDR47_08275 [Bacteroides sp.]|nr:hypothetical protein [Bacteroides sp.]
MSQRKTIQSRTLPLELIDNNTGQIPGVPPNPREMSIPEFKKLKASLMRDRQFTAICELKVYPFEGRWVAIGGNMRLHAMRELKWAEAVVKPIPADTPIETLRRWVILDNAHFGKWDFDKLANEYEVEDIANACINIPYVDTDDLLESTNNPEATRKRYVFSPEQADDIKRILKKAKQHMAKDIVARTGNANANGNALFTILEQWQPPKE